MKKRILLFTIVYLTGCTTLVKSPVEGFLLLAIIIGGPLLLIAALSVIFEKKKNPDRLGAILGAIVLALFLVGFWKGGCSN
jgi:hypothetical protein